MKYKLTLIIASAANFSYYDMLSVQITYFVSIKAELSNFTFAMPLIYTKYWGINIFASERLLKTYYRKHFLYEIKVKKRAFLKYKQVTSKVDHNSVKILY